MTSNWGFSVHQTWTVNGGHGAGARELGYGRKKKKVFANQTSIGLRGRTFLKNKTNPGEVKNPTTAGHYHQRGGARRGGGTQGKSHWDNMDWTDQPGLSSTGVRKGRQANLQFVPAAQSSGGGSGRVGGVWS